MRLAVHTENSQILIFNDDDTLQQITTKNKETHLTHYLKLSATNEEFRQLHYYQMPIFYIWNKKKKNWTKRIE